MPTEKMLQNKGKLSVFELDMWEDLFIVQAQYFLMDKWFFLHLNQLKSTSGSQRWCQNAADGCTWYTEISPDLAGYTSNEVKWLCSDDQEAEIDSNEAWFSPPSFNISSPRLMETLIGGWYFSAWRLQSFATEQSMHSLLVICLRPVDTGKLSFVFLFWVEEVWLFSYAPGSEVDKL